MAAQTAPTLVGHRGWPARWPENTLEGFAAAVAAGARWIECDVQLSSDRVPFVCHDVTLERTAGINLDVTQSSAHALDAASVGEPARFGSRFANVRLTRLTRLADWLALQPGVMQFVEIKRESLRHHGRQIMLDAVMQALRPALARCVIISFDHACLGLARAQGAPAIGWAVEHADEDARRIAQALRPEYMFTDEKLFTRMRAELPGDWQWIVYATDDAARALELTVQGAHMVETNDIGSLLRNLRLARK